MIIKTVVTALIFESKSEFKSPTAPEYLSVSIILTNLKNIFRKKRQFANCILVTFPKATLKEIHFVK